MRHLSLLLLWGCASAGAIDPASSTDPEPTDTAAPTVDTDTDAPSTPTSTLCPPVDADTRVAIVTDIDETLTTSDNEWLLQIANPSHDPEMRPDADVLMRAWFDLGYRVFYVSARGKGSFLLDGTSAREATEGWLSDHGFPYASQDVFLADGIGSLIGTAQYKADVLYALQDEGFELVYAYGNADTDVEAYKLAGIPDDHIFLVGKLAGQMGVQAIPTDRAYTAHFASFMPSQPCAP
jgi:phosphatidate phosphatase PAH1